MIFIVLVPSRTAFGDYLVCYPYCMISIQSNANPAKTPHCNSDLGSRAAKRERLGAGA